MEAEDDDANATRGNGNFVTSGRFAPKYYNFTDATGISD